ncbi:MULTISPECIES: efflux RND transporter periplasmic adaptor subunit [Marinobacter]|uniref:efflux RND transporter periplasmic adaptor subunit n=1 Tax=Marinobacter TaxID=2742 RepID=UPI00071901AB|nr:MULTISPECIES: efflux RND transporter periplasmic adaptor subunit [Marinobacter]AMQ89004.1 efflux transporter periplasmic adaptor subunit [Marinobacter sp. LQ44]
MQRVCIWIVFILTSASSGVLAQDRPIVRLEAVVEQEVVQEVSLNGTVNALRSSRISASVAGLLKALHVDIGDRVVTGDLLAELDHELVDWQSRAARAEVEEARARLAEAERRLREARSVGAGRNIAATEVSARESEVAAAEALLARLEAERQQIDVQVDRHRLVAPFDGIISHRSLDLGEWVTPGTELLRLVDTDNLALDFQVPQDYFARINENSELWISHHNDRMQADIVTLVPVNDAQSRTFLLRADRPDNLPVLPGMAVRATLRITTGERGLTVPRDAINRYPEGRVTVWIAEPEGNDTFTVSEKRVWPGTGFSGRIEITRGLEAGQQVVVRGNENLSQGVTVRIAEREAN